jgi:hypothetical protein
MIETPSSSSGRTVVSVRTSRALEPQRPRDGAFDDPPVTAELVLVLDASAGDADPDPWISR